MLMRFTGLLKSRTLSTVSSPNQQFLISENSIYNILKSGKIGDVVEIKGWIKSLRSQKENIFLDINDGSTCKKLQVLIPQKLVLDKFNPGSSVKAKGVLETSPKGQIELRAENVHLVGKCSLDEGYPFAPRKSYPAEYIRQYPHLRSRTNTFAALLRLRHATSLAIHHYFDKNGYTNIHCPILTSNDCEGAGEIFKVIPDNEKLLNSMAKHNMTADEAYFDRRVYLSVSGQLHLEAAAHGLSKVYSFGPTFRAENSKSRLHLSEFYMIEAEMAFLTCIDELVMNIEDLIKNITQSIIESSGDDIEACQSHERHDFSWIKKKFPVISFDEAVCILKEKFNTSIDRKLGLSKEQELVLVEYMGNVPTFVINWPKENKPFYVKACDNDESTVSALDLLVPGIGEVVGGSLREDDYDKLKNKLPFGSGAQLDWYLNLRKFGGVPTGGYGLGFERYLRFLSGINNIKDVIPFPRWPHNCEL